VTPLIETDEAGVRQALAVPGPVLVWFYAPWCLPCRDARRDVEALAGQVPSWAVFAVDIDAAPKAAFAAGITGVPWLAVYRDGVICPVDLGGRRFGGILGRWPVKRLRELVEAALESAAGPVAEEVIS
jgi:thioredoxin 1